MKKILALILAFSIFLPLAYSQDNEPVNALPEKGDVRIGIGWGWAFTMRFEDRANFGHTKPILPLHVYGDYTFLTFADGRGSLAGGAMFEFTHYQTWFTQTVKTTIDWTQGILAATATVRYNFGQDFEVFGKGFLGRTLQLGYEETYSDESYASIVPHTNGPGNSPASGLIVGFGHFTSEHMFISMQAGLGCFTTLGFGLSYKF